MTKPTDTLRRQLHVIQTRDAKTDCSYCQAPCCYLIVVLTEEEIDSGKYKTREVTMSNGTVTALDVNEHGRCVYGLPNGRCSIYEDRPSVCVNYTCREDPRIKLSMKYLGYR